MKKHFLVSAAAIALFVAACSDDSSSVPSTPNNPSISTPDATDPGSTPENQTPEIQGPQFTPSPVALAAGANPAYTANVYAAWKPFHFVTMEDESVYYANIASDFSGVFDEYLPVGRVIWQNGKSYSLKCENEGSTIPALRVRACSVSEGTGYGILLAYFNNDIETFNRLWNYSKGLRAYGNSKLIPWITLSFSYDILDESSATDADIDVATALILMYYKTLNQGYLDDALNLIAAIWDEEINPTTLFIRSGNTSMWNGKSGLEEVYNLSYFSPVALRLFAAVDANHNWTGVLDAMYAYMANVQAAGTGVLPDWSNALGTAVNPPNASAGKTEQTYTWFKFDKESVRIPWRIAWDYYWYQDPRALDVLSKLNAFIVEKSGGDPTSLALGTTYSWDPAKVDKEKVANTIPSQWLGAWCLTGIGTNPTWLEQCTAAVNAKMPSNTNSSYFSDILLALYSALLNGAFLRPF